MLVNDTLVAGRRGGEAALEDAVPDSVGRAVQVVIIDVARLAPIVILTYKSTNVTNIILTFVYLFYIYIFILEYFECTCICNVHLYKHSCTCTCVI